MPSASTTPPSSNSRLNSKSSLMTFVKGGKGIIGIHAATDNFYDWPEGAAMMGGLFDGPPVERDGDDQGG